ncbi:MAG: hypothetical protein ACE5K0_10695 [Candidatus Methanofastidiosia archaeon]
MKERFGIPLSHELLRDSIVTMIVVTILLFLSALVPPPLNQPADPLTTPRHLLPDWYFLWIYGFIKIAPKIEIFGKILISAKTLGIIVPILFVLFLFLLPFIDKGKAKRPVSSPFHASLGVFTVMLLFSLSVYSAKERIFEAFGVSDLILRVFVVMFPFLSGYLCYFLLIYQRGGFQWKLNKRYYRKRKK